MAFAADTIIALSTPPGVGAIALLRLSGPKAIELAQLFFSKKITESAGNTLHYGKFVRGGEVLDEVVLSLFRNPHSYTREDVVEISFHGSMFIVNEALNAFTGAGARLAQAGEFTQRAFLHGALDLAQAEAVADLIASQSALSHRIALTQMRGGVSTEIKNLRQQLLDFTSLIELELDFSEEDVEFADRSQLLALIGRILSLTQKLSQTFKLGNAIRTGVPVVIAGRPNAGKSTLLNALLGENRAIVSAIPGTTRDTIEETLVIEGIAFRFIDTAGLREAEDQIEAIGVSRTMEKIAQASVLLYLYDVMALSSSEAEAEIASLSRPGLPVIAVANKSDLALQLHDNLSGQLLDSLPPHHLLISAEQEPGLAALRQQLVKVVIGSGLNHDEVIISNARHYAALQAAAASLSQAQDALKAGSTADLVAIDIRHAVHQLGEITGEITTDEVLGNIFSKFCIGK